jgi:ABC-type glycerol-3-phosphate transport system permease component
MMAAVTLSIIPPVLLFIFAQRYFVRGIVMTGIKG